MSPHQRVFSFEAPAVKSRLIRSALAAAAGSGIAVFFHRFAVRPSSPAWRIGRATRLRMSTVPHQSGHHSNANPTRAAERLSGRCEEQDPQKPP